MARKKWTIESMQQYCDTFAKGYRVLDTKFIDKGYQIQQWALVSCHNKEHDDYWIWWNAFYSKNRRCSECYKEKNGIQNWEQWEVDILVNNTNLSYDEIQNTKLQHRTLKSIKAKSIAIGSKRNKITSLENFVINNFKDNSYTINQFIDIYNLNNANYKKVYYYCNKNDIKFLNEDFWSDDDLELLKNISSFYSIKELSLIFNRVYSGVYAKCIELELDFLFMRDSWKQEDVDFIKENGHMYNVYQLCQILNREKASIYRKCSRLNVKILPDESSWSNEEVAVLMNNTELSSYEIHKKLLPQRTEVAISKKRILIDFRCERKRNSKLEMVFEELLNNKGVKYKSQYMDKNCRNSRALKFDFAILNDDDSISCLVELNGIQHYEPVDYFGGEEGFQIQKYRDEIKRKYCIENGIELIEIPYYEFKNLEKIIDSMLKGGDTH